MASSTRAARRQMTRQATTTAIAVAAAAALAGPAHAAIGDNLLVSRASGAAGGAGDGGSSSRSVSADGRYVAFASGAGNLTADDNAGTRDVFVRDTRENTTTLVSAAAGGATADGASEQPSISADGRYVAFQSSATNLVAGDGNGRSDVFVRDLQSGATRRVSVTSAGAQATGGDSTAPSISADGLHVAFQSSATNLVVDDGNGQSDVFVRDLQTSATSRVSVTPAGAEASGGQSLSPAISADGNRIAFRSGATNLDTDDQDVTLDAYVRDRQAGTTRLVSRATGAGGQKGTLGVRDLTLSGNGRYVAMQTDSYLDPADLDNGDIYLRDLATDTTTLASRATGAAGVKGNGASDSPSLSADGRTLAFHSRAVNLDPADQDSGRDIYVRNLDTATTSLVSREPGASGARGNGESTFGRLAAGGAFVVFESTATNLVTPTTAGQQVFRRQIADPPAPAPAPAPTPIPTTTTPTTPAPTTPTPTPTPTGTTPARPITPPAPTPTPVDAAKLSVSRAEVRRSARRLELTFALTARATGRALVEFRAAGRTLRFSAPIEDGEVRISRRISAAQARLGTGIVTITYPGNGTVRPQTIRLRAASRPAGLRATRPTITNGTLTATGRTSVRATGVVRIVLSYTDASGTPKTRTYKVRIIGGRYRLTAELSSALRTRITTRRGTLDARIAYTGNLTRRIRGEATSYQVLPAR